MENLTLIFQSVIMIKTTKMGLQYFLGVITVTEKEKMLYGMAYSK